MFVLWPKGRVIRIIGLVLVALLVADLGYNGAYAAFAAASAGGEGAHRQIALGAIYGGLGLAVMVVGIAAVGFHRKAVEFLIEVEDEMTKVVWPGYSELWRSTLVIAIGVTLLAGMIFLSDLLLFKAVGPESLKSYGRLL